MSADCVGIDDYDDLLQTIYEGALRPEVWPAIVSAIAAYFDASRAVIWTFTDGPENGGFVFTHEISQAELEAWVNVARDQDPFVKAATERKLFVDGAVYSGDTIVPRRELVESRLYREVWSRWDIEHLCVTVIFAGSDGYKLPTTMSLYRSSAQSAFTNEELDRVGRVCVHLSRSLGVMFHLRSKDFEIAIGHAALDRLACGVVVLDRDGGVRHVNAAASRLLDRREVVQAVDVTRGAGPRLRTVQQSHAMERRFQSAIRSACGSLGLARPSDPGLAQRELCRPVSDEPGSDDCGLDNHFSAAIVLTGRDKRPVCIVHVAPLARRGTAAATVGCAILIFYDLAEPLRLSPDILHGLFGMTAAETRAAQEVAGGGQATDMAARLGISVNTFRSQLQAAYSKTNTHRNVDLLKLMFALSVASPAVGRSG